MVTSEPAGIDCGPICEGNFAAGAKIALTAKAEAGWSFSGWSGACFGPDTCAVDKLATTQIVGAVFRQDPPPPGISLYGIVEIPAVVGASGGTFASLQPRGINSLGQVVGGFNDCVSIGMSECDSGPFSAFLYDPSSRITVRISHPDAVDHIALAISDSGAILLNGNPFGLIDGVLLSNGNATHFGQDTELLGINPRGWVSGSKVDSRGQFAFLWDGRTISQLAPAPSLGAGVNAAGTVAGAILVDRRFHAAVFSDGGVRDLGTFSDRDHTMAAAINDRGRVVGISMDAVEHGFVYDLPAGPMRDILPNGSSTLSDVNNAGDAVGSVGVGGGASSAILWHDGTVIELTRALNDPSWTLLVATAINDKGQIVGYGDRNGQRHGFLLTPK